MENLIVPAVVSFIIGLPALIFAIVQWSKTWGRENKQIAATSMKDALSTWLEFERARLAIAEKEKAKIEGENQEIEDENANLRAENFELRLQNSNLRQENSRLREGRTLIDDALMEDKNDRDGT